MEAFKKTRIAPTPSGFLHLGNVLSFALTAAMARRSGASILLRIDDLDRERVSREFLADIFETLQFLQIPWDEGPRSVEEFEREWSQVHRLGMYREALERLRLGGKVFACDCSRSKIGRETADGVYPGTCREKGIPLETAGCSWRVRMDETEDARGVGGAAIVGGAGGAGIAGGAGAAPVEMKDFVVRKKDGYPAYQLTSVIDDLYFGVDLVVRGEDLRGSTAAQRWLAGELGLEAFGGIRFYHHPLLVEGGGQILAEGGGKKLSKSAGATSVRYLRKQGAGPAEIYSMILRWLGSENEVRNWQELAEASGELPKFTNVNE